jgi:tetratricopeptide (TPR) repeat protein
MEIKRPPPATMPEACSTAISQAATAREKAVLYFAWAYSLNEAGAAVEALPNLDKAIELAPNFINAVHERSYTLNDLGFYKRALTDSDRDVALQPQVADAYRERAFARHRFADFEGSLSDRLKVAELEGAGHDVQMGIIEELTWLGRYDEALQRFAALPQSDRDREIGSDLRRRSAFKADGGEAKRCVIQNVSDPAIAGKLFDDCTWAFDHEKDPGNRAGYLTTRATMAAVTRQQADPDLDDLQIAVALDPENSQRHINYGFALVSAKRSWAARNEFEIALAAPALSQRDKAWALAGRGRARANLGDLAGAMSDAKASFEIEPSEANVWLAGDLAFQNGDHAAAKKFWMAAYSLGARDSSLLEKLKSVGVENPDKERQ